MNRAEEMLKSAAIGQAAERAKREVGPIYIWRTLRDGLPCYWVRSRDEGRPEDGAEVVGVVEPPEVNAGEGQER